MTFRSFLDFYRPRPYTVRFTAGWSSLVARWAHNPKVVGSNPTPAIVRPQGKSLRLF